MPSRCCPHGRVDPATRRQRSASGRPGAPGRRRLHIGIIQAAYVLAAVALGLAVPHISVGFTVESSRVTQMLFAVGGAFVPFLGITYSLLFLVVQFGSTTFTPRLNLFRDSAIVWHGFSYFTAVIVFTFTAAFAVGKQEQATALIPALVILIVVGAIGVFRALQSSAFKSIQLASTLAAVTQRGRQVVDGVYPDETLDSSAASSRPHTVEGEVLWPGAAATLQAIDVSALVRSAERMDVVIELCVRPGEVIPERGRVAVVHGAAEAAADQLLPALRTGIERTFDQDPAMALRVLADLALRALSPAVNDPTTAVEALNGIDQLLRVLVRRDLAVGTARGSDGEARVVLRLPSWEDYVSVALDEIIEIGGSSPLVRGRVERLLVELVAVAPADREEALRARLERAGGARA
jgi:uncharacterized membrane protein